MTKEPLIDQDPFRKLLPLLATQALMFVLGLGMADFGLTLRVMPFSFAIYDVFLLYKKKLFLESASFRFWCAAMSVVVFFLSAAATSVIPWGWHPGPWF